MWEVKSRNKFSVSIVPGWGVKQGFPLIKIANEMGGAHLGRKEELFDKMTCL